MSTHPEGSAKILLDFATSGAYPSSSDFESDLLPADSQVARAALTKARDGSKARISSISRSLAPDVDGWITQAEQLQRDIEHSKAIARQIVEEAKQAEELRASRTELGQKARLLDIELQHTQRVRSSLRHIKNVATTLASGQESLKDGFSPAVLEHLKRGGESLSALAPLRGTTAVELLRERYDRLQQRAEEQASVEWDNIISVQDNKLMVSAGPKVEYIVHILSDLRLIHSKLEQLSGSIDRCILTPRLRRRPSGMQPRITCRYDSCELNAGQGGASFNPAEVIDDLTALVDFLNARLSHDMVVGISHDLMPSATTRLITDWLHPSIPTSLEDTSGFESLLKRVTEFAEHLAAASWHGAEELTEWVEQAPKEWLAKRRESALVSIRDVLAGGLKTTKEVERVETQMVSKDEVMTKANGEGEDDWGAAWGEEESSSGDAAKPSSESTGDEDVSAWDVETEQGSDANETSQKTSDMNGVSAESHDEDDAWGWQEPDSPTTKKHPPATKSNGIHPKTEHEDVQERQLTLKEKYTITAIPDELFAIMTQLLKDAADLQGNAYNDSPIQPAATGLYSLPTLVLAGYRSLATSFYISITGGNMYLYNDCVRLNSSLTAYAADLASKDQAASRRSKLDSDIETLTSFGKRAYGKEMEAQRTILRDLLDGAQGFINCTEAPYARECQSAIVMTVDRLRAVAAEWKPILSHSACLQSLGSLLGTVINKVLLEILDLGDISAEESTRLRELCDNIGALSDLFTEHTGTNGATKNDMTAIYTPDWFRFQYLGEILESNLADIKYMWQEEGLKLEFQAGEVVDLLEALFADSDRRRQAIAEIRRG